MPTLSYSEGAQGFPSFYSYDPDFMIGMNQYFYTFKSGSLWRHSVNERYNEFYGGDYPSSIRTVFNEQVLENKLFKTVNIEGDKAWKADLSTDLQTTGFIEYEWFERKEASFFAFVRNSPSENRLRSLNGIGNSVDVGAGSSTLTAYEIDFAVTINIGDILSVGDLLYRVASGGGSATFVGQVIEIRVDKPKGINKLVVNTIADQQGVPFPTPGSIPGNPITYFLYEKNSIAESHGVLGHYCVIDLYLKELTYDDIDSRAQGRTELFAVESEVMKSYP